MKTIENEVFTRINANPAKRDASEKQPSNMPALGGNSLSLNSRNSCQSSPAIYRLLSATTACYSLPAPPGGGGFKGRWLRRNLPRLIKAFQGNPRLFPEKKDCLFFTAIPINPANHAYVLDCGSYAPSPQISPAIREMGKGLTGLKF